MKTWLVVPILMLGLACSSDRPEDRVRKAFEACVAGVEKGDAGPSIERLHPAFSGPEGMDKAQAKFFLFQTLRQQKIGVTVLSSAIQVKGSVAQQQIDVLFTGRDGKALLPDDASRRHLELRWELHEKDWKLSRVREGAGAP